MGGFAETAQTGNSLRPERRDKLVATHAARMHGHALGDDNADSAPADPRDMSSHCVADGGFLGEIADCRQPHDAVLGDFRPQRKRRKKQRGHSLAYRKRAGVSLVKALETRRLVALTWRPMA